MFDAFETYYSEFLSIPKKAQRAFEDRAPGESLELSQRRLHLYAENILLLAGDLREAITDAANRHNFWRQVEEHYLPLIDGRYEADLAFAFYHSIHRMLRHGEWTAVEYDFEEGAFLDVPAGATVHRTFPGGPRLEPDTVAAILGIPGFKAPYQDMAEDAELIAEQVNTDLGLGVDGNAYSTIEIINAGFFRNRGAYLMGRIILSGGGAVPLVIALLNGNDGIYADAVITREADAHNLFSSTLANFHVTEPHYHELAVALKAIMPNRPLSLHYSTIGFNHLGKVAVMNEIKNELIQRNEVFETAVGEAGTVAIGFSAPSSVYTLKVIRNTPTAQYKWGTFEGIETVINKYRRVHEINRTGSMLDNIIYVNLRLDASFFDTTLLDEILAQASDTVSYQGDDVVFKSLIVQRKMIPIPVFLETASAEDANTVIENLGRCIKNNAAANIFNKDLDARNYGVGGFLKVFLFDYDALEPFTEIKIRTNINREDGEEDAPEWVFEDGVIFLPEELDVGFRISDRKLIRRFRDIHGELSSTEYWQSVQDALLQGQVPSVSVYPEECRLKRKISSLGTYY